MEENVYKEACNVYSSCNEDGSNDYEEVGTVSPSTVSAARRAPDLNPAKGTSDVSGEPGSSGSQSNDKRQATDPGPVSAETTGYIPGVGMSSPGQSQVWASTLLKTYAVVTMVLICCLLGVTIFLAVTVSDLKLSSRRLDQKTTDDLSDLKLSVSHFDNKTAEIQAKVSEWMQRQQTMGQTEDVSERLVENEKALHNATTHLPATCPDGYKKHREVCYKAFHMKKSFSESAQTCSAYGGTLAMPRDVGIHDFLLNLTEIGHYWFGLQQQEGKWEWIDGTALGTGYNRWPNGEPGNFGGYCTMYEHAYNWWYNSDCHKTVHFICQVLPSAAPDK